MPYEIGSRRSWYNWRISFYTVRYLNIQWYLVSTLVTADDLFRPLSSPPCFEGTEEAHSARGRIQKMIEVHATWMCICKVPMRVGAQVVEKIIAGERAGDEDH